MNKGVTIRQIALKAGCSHTTVSLALRNHPGVSVQMRDKIRGIADEIGYTRDPLVSTLMGRLRTKKKEREGETLALINCWDTREGDRATILGRELHEGIIARVNTLGYNVDHLWAKERGMTASRLSRILHARGIRGVLLLSMLHARGHIPLDWRQFAGATIGYTLLKPELHRACYSHYDAMVLTLRVLRQRGYQRIGFTNLIEQEDMVNNERLSAYLGYHFRVFRTPPLQPLLVGEWDRVNFGNWLIEQRPQVVISNNPRPYFLMAEMGIGVPAEIGYASLDCIPQLLDCAGVRQPRQTLGVKAIELVIEQLENYDFGIPEVPKTVIIKGHWRDGPTVLHTAERSRRGRA